VTEAMPRQVTIYIGTVFAAREPTVIETLLGSCVAVCLWDPETRVGGMNHFLLRTRRTTPASIPPASECTPWTS